MRVAVLATGGKDSALSLYHTIRAGHEVAFLVSMIPLSEDSWMFHYPNIWLVDLFAKACGLCLVKFETAGEKETEVKDLEHVVEGLDVEGLVSGAIASQYQKTRIEKVCSRLKIKCITPLWHMNPADVLQQLLDLKFDVIITAVSAHGFTPEWLARRIDENCVEDLLELNRRYGVSPVGEGGEYESLVLDAPFFSKRIEIVEAEKTWRNERGYFLVSKARLREK